MHAIPALTILATLGLFGWLLARRLAAPKIADRLLVGFVLGVLCFQLVHFFEHLMQISHWLVHPGESPWITPWGALAADNLAAMAGHPGGRVTGVELLHLAGNWITFTGIVALYVAMRGWHIEPRRTRATRVAFWLQLVHLLEHVSLTSSWLVVGRAIGLSTLFGLSYYLDDLWASSAWSASIRTWWHFVMVLVPTVVFLLALREFRRVWLTTPGAPEAKTAPATKTSERSSDRPGEGVRHYKATS
jgi:hypothetical protein